MPDAFVPIVPEDQEIHNILLAAVVNKLTEDLIIVPDTDTTAEAEAVAGLVRAGKLQADPTKAGINVLVHPGGEAFPDKLSDSSGSGREIGTAGLSFLWLVRFKIQLKLFYNKELERTTAQIKSGVVLTRAHRAITRLNKEMRSIPTDDFGAHPIMVTVVDTFLREGGGVREFIWNGELKVEFLVQYRFSQT